MYHYYMKAGELQMNLRKKRHPTSYQNEDNYMNLVGVRIGHPRHREKSTELANCQEPPSRTNEHGNIGRLLVQFINQINYNCRQNKRSKEREKRQALGTDDRIGSEPRKKLKQDMGNDSASGQMRRGTANNDDRPEKADQKRLLKELYRFKDQQHPNLKNLLQDPKAYTRSQPNQPGQQNIVDYMQMVQNLGQEYLMNAYPSLSSIPSLQTLSNMNNMNLNLSMLMQGQMGQKIQSYPVTDTRHVESQKKEKAPESKLFKRAAFHVAIAYHIHLRKVTVRKAQTQAKEKNRDSAEMDPTYHARKLRERNNAQIKEAQKKPEATMETQTKVNAPAQVSADDNKPQTHQVQKVEPVQEVPKEQVPISNLSVETSNNNPL